MIVLDTNIVSEPWRKSPDAQVIDWLNSQSPLGLYICSPVLAELWYGLERLDAGARKEALRHQVTRVEQEAYRDRILAFDSVAAAIFGHITAARERVGRRMDALDATIAAIALANGATLATRDVSDFSGIGLSIINPFEALHQDR
jgi:predicted nucleic acid-binding protein